MTTLRRATILAATTSAPAENDHIIESTLRSSSTPSPSIVVQPPILPSTSFSSITPDPSPPLLAHTNSSSPTTVKSQISPQSSRIFTLANNTPMRTRTRPSPVVPSPSLPASPAYSRPGSPVGDKGDGGAERDLSSSGVDLSHIFERGMSLQLPRDATGGVEMGGMWGQGHSEM